MTEDVSPGPATANPFDQISHDPFRAAVQPEQVNGEAINEAARQRALGCLKILAVAKTGIGTLATDLAKIMNDPANAAALRGDQLTGGLLSTLGAVTNLLAREENAVKEYLQQAPPPVAQTGE